MSATVQMFRQLNKAGFGSDSVSVLLAIMQKYPAPESWLYKEARDLFLKPEVVDCSTVELKWNEPDEEGLIQFMCNEKQFRWTASRLSTTLYCLLGLSFSCTEDGWWQFWCWLLQWCSDQTSCYFNVWPLGCTAACRSRVYGCSITWEV